MSRLPLIALAIRCRLHADEFALAAKIARTTAEEMERIICYGTDSEVSEALKMADHIPEP
jgi:triosephosphate isomerase